ncbi:DNA-binding response regulator [Niallia alba]|uniref:DNA-binding response regulator n=1 Tax=Niallia alba TaxID=2729105 RepID=UPI00399FF228
MNEVGSQQIETILKDYHWMMNSIKILRDSMKDAAEWETARYGNESAMSKAKGTNSDPVYKETARRLKRYKKIAQYEDSVQIIQDRMIAIEDDREFEVLNWLLEGKSYRWIALHMGLSHTQIIRMKDSIVEKIRSYVPYVTKDANLN